jgi:uncharacterized secreted protein with C-terminal beta-propeller domain
MTNAIIQNEVYVTFKGQSANLMFADLNLTADMTDQEIRERVAQHFDRAVAEMDDYAVVREANGNITVRPSAEFGV